MPDVKDNLYKEVDNFIKKHSDKRIIYFHVGLDPPKGILNKAERCIRSLLNIVDVALITNIHTELFKDVYDEDFCFSRSYLPMSLICSSADLMIHQCGSGTYNYQLIFEVPGIILGSRCYDRDDVAKQLDSMGLASYISEDLPETEYFGRFNRLIKQLLDHSSTEYIQQKILLVEINKEIQ